MDVGCPPSLLHLQNRVTVPLSHRKDAECLRAEGQGQLHIHTQLRCAQDPSHPPKPGSSHYRCIRKIRDAHTPPHGHPQLTSSSAASEKQAPAVCSSHPLFPRHHHETLSIPALPLKGRLRLTTRRGMHPTATTAMKSSTAGREAEVTEGPPHTGTLTCFSFSSSSRSRSSMQLRACRKAFLCERSVKMRTKTPYMFTPTKSRALAPSCRERTVAQC